MAEIRPAAAVRFVSQTPLSVGVKRRPAPQPRQTWTGVPWGCLDVGDYSGRGTAPLGHSPEIVNCSWEMRPTSDFLAVSQGQRRSLLRSIPPLVGTHKVLPAGCLGHARRASRLLRQYWT